MESKVSFNLYVWKDNREMFALVHQPTKLINKLLAAYFEKQRQIEAASVQETLSAAERDRS